MAGRAESDPARHGVRFAGWPRAIVFLVVLGGGAFSLPSVWTFSPLLAVTNGLVSATFLATAVLLGSRPDQQGNAWLFGATSLFWTAGYLGVSQRPWYGGSSSNGPFAFIQYVAGPLCFATLASALLRYPEARLQREERAYVRSAAVVVVSLRLTSVAVSRPTWHDFTAPAFWPTIVASRTFDSLVDILFTATVALLSAAFTALLVLRLRRARGIDRRMLLPVVVAATAVGTVVASEVASHLLPEDRSLLDVVFTIEAAALLTVPTAFLAATIRQSLSHAAVAGLILQLAQPMTPARVREALRSILNDPSLDVAYWLPDYEAYFDAEGRACPALGHGAEQFTKYVPTMEGKPLARVTVDPSLRRYPSLVDAATSAVGLALENGQLHSELRAQLEEVRVSRARILTAADAERRRLERNLHDGAQQRILALKLELLAARTAAEGVHERALIDRTRAELHETLEELRELAGGIHPAVLTQFGLTAAVGRVAARLPLDIALDIPLERWAPVVEGTVYYTTCESLSNAVKHARATKVRVSVSHRVGALVVEITDDGVGGANIGLSGGLLGLQDRVAAVGGDLLLSSPPGGGTRVRATIPSV